MKGFPRLNQALRQSLVFVAIFGLVRVGVAAPQGAHKGLRCGSEIKLDTVLNHPEDYFGKTVTVEGEMHRTFSDNVFSIEDDDFLRDDDLLIITNASKSEVVKPVKDSIEEGEDVCVTGVIQAFHRSEMESKFGPLNIESRANHYKEGSAVMVIERTKAAAAAEREKPLPLSNAEPVTEPVPSELESRPEAVSPESPEPETNTGSELPATGGPLPLIGLSGVLSLLAAAGIRLRRRQ